MKTKNLLLAGFLILLFPGLIFAQATGTIRGRIIDAQTGEPVFGANVMVRAANAFAETDFDGNYQFSLPAGTHTVEVQMIGFDNKTRSVTVGAGGSESANFTLGIQELDVVEVEGRALNNTEASMLALQKKSGSVSDGVSAEAIKKSPDSSAGEVLKRVTGISLIGGKYVFVRGLGERYSTTELNGAPLPSPEPEQRVVPMDLFSAALIKNIRVMKTFTPENTGEFSGGLVAIETKEYPDEFTLNIGGGVGANSNTTGKAFKQIDGGGNDYLGLYNDKLGLGSKVRSRPEILEDLPNSIDIQKADRFGGIPEEVVQYMGAAMNNNWDAKTIQAPLDRNFSFTVGDTIQIGDVSKIGYVAGTSYSRKWRYVESEDTRYVTASPYTKLSGDYSYLTPDKTEKKKSYNQKILWGNNLNLTAEIDNGQRVYSKTFYAVNSDIFYNESLIDQNYNELSFQTQTSGMVAREMVSQVFGGMHALPTSDVTPGDAILTWNYSYGEANRNDPDRKWRVWGTDQGTLDDWVGEDPQADGTRYWAETQDIVRTAKVDLEVPFSQWDGLVSKAKIGALNMEREKSFEADRYASAITGGVTDIDYYPVPGSISMSDARFYPGSNYREFKELGLGFDAYNARQGLHAYYAQVDMPIVPGLRFLGGARYESSKQTTRTFLQKDENSLATVRYGCASDSQFLNTVLIARKLCNSSNNGVGEIETQDLLPSLNFTYELNKDMNLRFAYSETVTRPDLRELSEFYFAGEYKGDATAGNYDLNRTYIHNYDFRYEWYMNATDYIGAGLFHKVMSDPIEEVGYKAPDQSIYYQKTNAVSATITGIELDGRMDFLEYFRGEVNAFFIRSRVEVMSWNKYYFIRSGIIDPNSREAVYQPSNLERPLQGQSPYVYNLKLTAFLDKEKNHSIGIYYNTFGERVRVVGTDGAPDVIEKPADIIDLVYTGNIDENFSVKASAKNITDTRYRWVQRDQLLTKANNALGYDAFYAEKTYKSYREGVDWSASLTYKF